MARRLRMAGSARPAPTSPTPLRPLQPTRELPAERYRRRCDTRGIACAPATTRHREHPATGLLRTLRGARCRRTGPLSSAGRRGGLADRGERSGQHVRLEGHAPHEHRSARDGQSTCPLPLRASRADEARERSQRNRTLRPAERPSDRSDSGSQLYRPGARRSAARESSIGSGARSTCSRATRRRGSSGRRRQRQSASRSKAVGSLGPRTLRGVAGSLR